MLAEKIKTFPNNSWIYIWKKWNKVLYVWKAKNLKKRLEQYFRNGIWVWKEDMVSKATDIEYLLTRTEEEALILENSLIKKYSPAYNCLLKWDNNYTYIRITNEDFPQIEFTRYKDKNWIYIWPKPWKKDTKDVLQLLRQILKFRTCSNTKFKQWKVCSDFILWLCSWWCTFNKDKKEYKEIVKIIIDFFNWNSKKIKNIIKWHIDKAITQQNYEYANILKKIYIKIKKLTNKQSIELNKNISWYFIKIKKQNRIYFMIYAKFIDWKLIDIVKLKNNENNFLKTMKQDWLIKNIKELWENYYFAK